MAKSVERYFRMMRVERGSRPSSRLWCPAADVYRTRDGWIVKVDLAGVSPDDLKITVEAETLRVAGCRKDTFYGEGVSCQQLEITYSRFEKVLHFPCSIERTSVRRDYRDGLLILYLRSSSSSSSSSGDDCE